MTFLFFIFAVNNQPLTDMKQMNRYTECASQVPVMRIGGVIFVVIRLGKLYDDAVSAFADAALFVLSRERHYRCCVFLQQKVFHSF